MKYLLPLMLLLAGCDDQSTQQPTPLNDPRFTTACLPEINTPSNHQANLFLSIIKDVKTGAEYLVVQDGHGLMVTKLEPLTPEKAP